MPWAKASDGVRIHYEVIGFGKRPPVLFVQGLGAEKNGWNLQRAALALRWRTIALDNRGAGRTDAPDRPYSIRGMATDLEQLLDAVSVQHHPEAGPGPHDASYLFDEFATAMAAKGGR